MSVAFALSLAAAPTAASGDIVFNTGGRSGGSIYAMADNGSDVRLLASGDDYQKPYVALDGTVLFTDYYSILFPSGSVHAYKNGTAGVLANDFPGAAEDAEAGFAGRYVFKNIVEYGKDILREGQLSSGTTTPLTLCQEKPTFGPDPKNSNLAGYWETTTDEPDDPSVSPTREEFVFSGCTWRRHFENDTVVIENIPFLTSVTPAEGEQWLIKGESNWSFNDASWSSDGSSLVFLYWRGYDTHGLQREADEGIWVSDADGANPRQVLSLHTGDLAQVQNFFSPRLTGDGRIVFEFTDWIDQSRDGIYSVPASCVECTMDAATLLSAGASEPAWTPLHIAAPANGPGPTTGGSSGTGSGSGQSAGGPGTTASSGVPSAGTAGISTAQIAALVGRQLTPSGKAAKIAALLKNGGLTMPFTALEAGTAVIRWYQVPPGAKLATKAKAKPILVASGRMTFSAAETRKIKIRLTAAGKRLLKHAKRLKLTGKATFTPSNKATVSVTKGFVLKR